MVDSVFDTLTSEYVDSAGTEAVSASKTEASTEESIATVCE